MTLKTNKKGTASEATLVSLLAAKMKTLKRVQSSNPELDGSQIVGQLIAYASGMYYICNYMNSNATLI